MGPTPAETTKPVTPTEEALVVAIGPGGNIGSSLWPHLARMPGVGAVRLIDRDHYEPSNFSSQNIMPGDVGRAKARAVATKRTGNFVTEVWKTRRSALGRDAFHPGILDAYLLEEQWSVGG